MSNLGIYYSILLIDLFLMGVLSIGIVFHALWTCKRELISTKSLSGRNIVLFVIYFSLFFFLLLTSVQDYNVNEDQVDIFGVSFLNDGVFNLYLSFIRKVLLILLLSFGVPWAYGWKFSLFNYNKKIK